MAKSWKMIYPSGHTVFADSLRRPELNFSIEICSWTSGRSLWEDKHENLFANDFECLLMIMMETQSWSISNANTSDVFKKVESSFNGILSILYSMFKRCLKAGSYYNTNLLRPTMDLGISVGVGRWEIFYLCDTAVHCKFPVTSNWSERAFRVDESCHGAL